jgi:hypothetical protein
MHGYEGLEADRYLALVGHHVPVDGPGGEALERGELHSVHQVVHFLVLQQLRKSFSLLVD